MRINQKYKEILKALAVMLQLNHNLDWFCFLSSTQTIWTCKFNNRVLLLKWKCSHDRQFFIMYWKPLCLFWLSSSAYLFINFHDFSPSFWTSSYLKITTAMKMKIIFQTSFSLFLLFLLFHLLRCQDYMVSRCETNEAKLFASH